MTGRPPQMAASVWMNGFQSMFRIYPVALSMPRWIIILRGFCVFPAFLNHRAPLPHLPRRIPLGIEIVEALLVLEGVHAAPEPVVLVGGELALVDEALEG